MSEEGVERAKSMVKKLLDDVIEMHESGEINGFVMTGAVIGDMIIDDDGREGIEADSFMMGIGMSKEDAMCYIKDSIEKHEEKVSRGNFGLGFDPVDKSIEIAIEIHGDKPSAKAVGLMAGIDFLLNQKYPKEVITKGLAYNFGLEYLKNRKGEELSVEEIQEFSNLINIDSEAWATEEEAIGYAARSLRKDYHQVQNVVGKIIPWKALMRVAEGIKKDLYIEEMTVEQVAGILKVTIETGEEMR